MQPIKNMSANFLYKTVSGLQANAGPIQIVATIVQGQQLYSRFKSGATQSELKTLEWRISRLTIDPLFY